MAGEKAAVKGLQIATQNLKGFTNLAGKVASATRGNFTAPASPQHGAAANNEEFTHILDGPMMSSCLKAIKLQSLVKTFPQKNYLFVPQFSVFRDMYW